MGRSDLPKWTADGLARLSEKTWMRVDLAFPIMLRGQARTGCFPVLQFGPEN